MIHVGTSGWHYKHWIGPFYPPKTRAAEMLAYYAKHFDIVELNNTFYKLPTEEAVISWRDSTPPNFRFAMKGSRFLTHMKKLADTGRGIDRFFSCAELLDKKLGPIVFQLPPKWTVNVERLRDFLAALPRGHRYAFEFRNETWNDKAVLDVLRKFNAAYCIFELSGFRSPLEITADFTYIRLHGPDGAYQGSYDDRSLRAWARRLREWNLRESYVFFDNDQAGYAAINALRLKALLKIT
jgi:uncharacterized protein YecE (DUF72 family)